MEFEDYLKAYIHRYDREPFLDYFDESDFPGLVKEEYTLEYCGYKLSGGYFFYPNYVKDELVIFCNGIGSGYVNYMTEIASLAKAGYKVLDLDLLGDFNSPGDSIRSLSEALAILDSLLNDLAKNEWYKKTRIMVVGHSLGGYAASNILHFHPEVKNIVAISPFMSIESLAIHYGGEAALAYELKMNPLYACKSSFDCLKNTNSHVLIIHSIDDNIVPYEENTGFLKANINNPNVSFLIVDKKGHNPNYTEDGVAYMKESFSKLYKLNDFEKMMEFKKEIDFKRIVKQDDFVFDYILQELRKR